MNKLWLLISLAHLAACGGGDAVCGDGTVDPGEQCDDGNTDDTDNCRACEAYLPPRTTIKWLFDADVASGFSQDSCVDLHVVQVQVDLAGPATASKSDDCPNHQIVFEDLSPGDYTATVTPLDSGGHTLLSAPATMAITASTTDSEHTIDIAPDQWTGPYTGSFYFTLHWGGADCATAAPPVAQQVVTLRVGGVPVTQLSTAGEPLDGSAAVTCVPPSIAAPITALLVPFGLATIEVEGRDSGGVTAFRGQFDTFVGAGESNPALDFDVATVYDAMPADAAVPDAAPIDAM